MPLIVSTSKTIKVPSVVGKQRQQAMDLLESQGLTVSQDQIIEVYNEKVPKDQIIMQMPFAGSDVKEGRRIYLTISRGNETVLMPDLTMMTQRDAQAVLMRLHLNLGTVTWDWKDSIPEDRVFRQSFAPGLAIPPNSTVNLVLSKDSTNTVIAPALERLTQDEAMTSLTEIGLVVGEIVQEKDETFTPGTVIRQQPGAGMRVKLGSTVKLWVSSTE